MGIRRLFSLRSSEEPRLSDVHDLAVDLGTATGLVYSNQSYGQITIEDTLKGETRTSNHIRTIIAQQKPSGDQLADSKEKFRIEADSAKSHKLYEKDEKEQHVAAVGQEAFQRWGRSPHLSFDKAIERGNIGNIHAYRACMRYLIRMRYPEFRHSFENGNRKPRLLTGVPRNATDKHIETIKLIIEDDIKATPVVVWEQVAACVGAKLANNGKIQFREPKSVAIADIGGGTIDFAVLSNGSVTDQKSYETAGDELDSAIVAYLSAKHNVDVGHRTAIMIKEALGSAVPCADDDEVHKVNGSSFETERPASVEITKRQIREECLMPVLRKIGHDFKSYLETLHAYGDIHGDIFENGFYLTGGTAHLAGLDQFLRAEIGLEIIRVENAMTSVIDGLKEMLEDPELLKLGLVHQQAA